MTHDPDPALITGPTNDPASLDQTRLLPSVTVGVVNYNGLKTLPAVLDAIGHLSYPVVEVLVVDNASQDGSREWVQEVARSVRCLCLDHNQGLPGARNVILREAETDYVFILDNDIAVQPDTLKQLAAVMIQVPGAAACHPEIRDPRDPDQGTHYNGGSIHYLCAHVPRTYAPGPRPAYEVFDVVSGGALLIDRRAAMQVGGFDSDFFFNWEDGDFTARLTLAGYRCLNVPDAVVFHEYKSRGTDRAFFQVRNRWYFMLKLYSWRTLLLAAPMLILFELTQALFLFLQEAAGDYWRANLAVVRQLPQILAKRRAFGPLKRVRDRDWLQAGDLYVPPALLRNRWLGLAKGLFTGLVNGYWRLIRPLC